MSSSRLGNIDLPLECAGGHFGISVATYFLLIPCIPENERRLLAWTFFSPLFLDFFFFNFFFKVKLHEMVIIIK